METSHPPPLFLLSVFQVKLKTKVLFKKKAEKENRQRTSYPRSTGYPQFSLNFLETWHQRLSVSVSRARHQCLGLDLKTHRVITHSYSYSCYTPLCVSPVIVPLLGRLPSWSYHFQSMLQMTCMLCTICWSHDLASKSRVWSRHTMSRS